MAVLPSDSSHAIPKAGRWLMSDLESPIIDFYPTEVPVDPNGKAMPWLWVVLLPFIDESRLLAAMTPTMAKWTKEELLCNARGLDDGYVFLHSSHPLAPKFKQVLTNGKNPKSKQRITDAACPGFTGSLRLPLSNEMITESQVVPAPHLSSKATMSSEENLFTDDISENNCLCLAFTEPARQSHKSIVLPGTQPPPPTLKEEDKRISRPRLNRGGQSIAYMGGSNNNQRHQSGHGSMNISSYERELAQRNGRGHEMNKAGTRSWGSFEPAPKRQYRARNPFQRNANGVPPPPPPPPPPPQRPPWQQQQSRPGYQNQQQHMRRPVYNNSFRPGQQRPPQQMNQQGHQNNVYQGQHSLQRGQNRSHGSGGQAYNHRPQYHQQHNNNRQQQSQQGFNFRSYNQSSGPSNSSSTGRQASSVVNNNVMNSLKNQLKNTLKQNRNRKANG